MTKIPIATAEHPIKVNVFTLWKIYRKIKKWLKHRKDVLA